MTHEVFDDVGEFELTIAGSRVLIRAHGYSEDAGAIRFVLLARDDPNYEITVAIFPIELVENINGG